MTIPTIWILKEGKLIEEPQPRLDSSVVSKEITSLESEEGQRALVSPLPHCHQKDLKGFL